jgi:hypothetical protein
MSVIPSLAEKIRLWIIFMEGVMINSYTDQDWKDQYVL